MGISTTTVIILVLVIIVGILYLSLQHFIGLTLKQRHKIKSLSIKYGKYTEQFLPLVNSYPYDKNRFRFLGSPIDGVQFEDDKIIFVEFKSGSSQLSSTQKHIRELIKGGKIEWKEIRIPPT